MDRTLRRLGTARFLSRSGLLLALAIPRIASAETYLIQPDGSGDFPTIRAAVAAAVDGDVIELADGTHDVPVADSLGISFAGKAITIRSAGGDAEACVVNGRWAFRAFRFTSGEGPGSVLENVTVTRCAWAGAIYGEGSSPTIRGCIIADNTDGVPVPFTGDGIRLKDSQAVIDGCVIRNNDEGAAIWCDASSPQVTGTVMATNWYGVYSFNGSSPSVTGCTIVGTWHDAVAGGEVSLDHTLVAFNAVGVSASAASLACCDVFGNVAGDWVGGIADQAGRDGNFAADPLFCGPGDYHLRTDSPCAPPGVTGCGLVGALVPACDPTSVRTGSWARVKHAFR